MSLLIASLVLAMFAAGWVVVPLLARRVSLLGDAVSGGILDADARKRVALASLKEIEYDRMAGKLDDEDYAQLRATLEREALWAIEAAEQAHGGEAVSPLPVTHSCGFPNPAGSRFCSGCGAGLGAVRA